MWELQTDGELLTDNNLINSLQKMVVVLAVVAVLLGAAEARIAGSLGEGWHYLAPGLQLADLLPPPTRSPRQIIGSRSVWTVWTHSKQSWKRENMSPQAWT